METKKQLRPEKIKARLDANLNLKDIEEKMRECLYCEKQFKSSGVGHRRCGKCETTMNKSVNERGLSEHAVCSERY